MSAALARAMREVGCVGRLPAQSERGRMVYLLSGSEYERDCWEAENKELGQARSAFGADSCERKRKATGGNGAVDAQGVARPRGWVMQSMLAELSRSDGSASELGRSCGINRKSSWPTMIHLCNLGLAREMHVANDTQGARRELHKGTKKIYKITAEGLEWLKERAL